nr:MAG: ORF1 [Torque teno midi virus]
MPFWWRRRRKPWFTTWRQRRYNRRRRRNTYKRRKPRYTRRRSRRLTRRRRRRKYKVRRKQKKIHLTQWQPDRIRKCKIKGRGTLIMGAQGRQYMCYTNVKDRLTPSRAPAGGGFGVERFTLEYLYKQWKARNNIWTATNKNTDLVRYLGCRFTFYRHPDTDFIVNYSRQPPFNIDKYTYMSMQPQEMLLGKHKKIILSKLTKPTGRIKHTLKIGPPKLLTNKWMFQEQFATQDLVQIAGTAANFRYPTLGCCNENRILNLFALDTSFYQNVDWMQTRGQGIGYKPYSTIDKKLTFHYKTATGTATVQVDQSDETKWLTIDGGWFQPKILQAYKVTLNGYDKALLPLVPIRYNPAADDGTGNLVTIVDLVAGHWTGNYTDAYTIKNVPLWMALNGYASYVQAKSGDKGILTHSMIIVSSEAITRLPTASTQTVFPLLSSNFVNGKAPYYQPLTDTMKKNWYPSYEIQQETINDIVCCGPLVPKLYNQTNSTWELQYFYCFYFKWGGPEITDQDVEDPKSKGHYPTDSSMQRAVQVSNPLKNKTNTILHAWDFRRGIVTNTALKRMCEDLETDTTFQPDTEPAKKKKKVTCQLRNPEEENEEIQSCLLSLCQESSSQEEKTTDLQQLILKQRIKQQQLKHNILTLLTELKKKQDCLRLQTGNLE